MKLPGKKLRRLWIKYISSIALLLNFKHKFLWHSSLVRKKKIINMKINIKVRVLDKGKRFQLSYNQGSLKRTTASKIYNIVEKRLLKLKKIPLSVPSLASRVKGKIKVYVDYRQDGGFNNSGEYFSSSEALYVF